MTNEVEKDYEIDALQAEVEALVEAIARRSRGREKDETLYEYVWMNWPTLWEQFGGKDMTPEPSPESAALANVARVMKR